MERHEALERECSCSPRRRCSRCSRRRPEPTGRLRLLAATAGVIVVAELLANDGAVVAALGLSAWGVAITALLLLVVLPRTDPAAHPLLAWSFAITALVTCVAFWSALPFAFGVGAIAATGRLSSAPSTLGVLAMAVAFVFSAIA